MPELPEVEAVVRSLREDGIEGASIASAMVHRPSSVKPQLPDSFTAACLNRTIDSVERRAKNILLHLSDEKAIRVHLRMTGDLRMGTSDEAPAFVRIEWHFSDGRVLRFTDPRTLGRVHVYKEAELQEKLASVGVEPLSKTFTAKKLAALTQKSRLPAKLFLMDQTKVAGLGNIYAAEALFRAGISPATPMNAIDPDRIARLHAAIRQVLRGAVQSVYKAYRSPQGYRNHRDDFNRMVYGRLGKPCQVCGNEISRVRQGGRSTYFCGHCQR